MSIESLVDAVLYVANAVVFLSLAASIARVGRASKARSLRVSLLSLLVFADACFLLWVDCSGYVIAMLAVLVGAAATTFPPELTSGLNQTLGKARFGLFVASVFTVAALFYVYLPITTFLTSPGELSIHLEYLLTTNAKAGMMVMYVASALYAMAFSPRLKSLLALLALSTLLLTVVYSYAFPFGYPMMNGLMFEQMPIEPSELARRAVLDALAVPGGVLLSAWMLHRLGGRRVLLGIALLNVSLGIAAVATVYKDRVETNVAAAQDEGVHSAQPLRFSRTQSNALLIFLDRMMGGFVEEILEDEPELLDDLEGFSWYPRTVAPGENSVAGVHALLGGYDYTPREMNKRNRLLRDLSVESFAILPRNFTDKGYTAQLVNPRGLGFTAEGDCSFLNIEGLNCAHVPASAVRRLAEHHEVSMKTLADSMYADLLVLLGVMRGTPYMMRSVVHERGPWRPFLDHSAGTTFKQWAELKALPSLTRTDAQGKNLNIFFNMLPHEPYFMGEDCMPKAKMTEVPPAAKARHATAFAYQHYVAARCTLLLVADYLNWMRKEGVYDNTKIVIVSDHGIVGDVVDRSTRAVAGKTTENLFVRSRSVLLVKEREARGPLRISEDFLPNAEAPRILCEEIGGCVNPYLGNKTIEAHGRNDPFYVDFVPWQFNAQNPRAFRIEGELMLRGGDPYDHEGWTTVNKPR